MRYSRPKIRIIPNFLKILMKIISLLTLSMLAGCMGINEYRTTGTFIEDFSIERKVSSLLKNDKELKEKTNVSATSYNETLLLTGQVPNQRLRNLVINRASKIRKVKKVHDYLTIAAPSSIISRSNDGYLTTKVKTRILATAIFKKDKNVEADRIKVVTENSIVYLLGVLTKQQAKTASKIARQTPGVQKVVSLWELL